MAAKTAILIFALVVACAAQRSPYAGRRPVGYPALETTSTTTTTVALQNELGNRFGDNTPQSTTTTTTTQRLPIEALGDRDLVDRISKLPRDQQPFWYLNWKLLEEHRSKPQTYPQKVSPFLENNRNSLPHFFFRR